MSYMHIDNLYKAEDILMFKECYALEKIHGTSAHISWKEGEIKYFSGGSNHENFKKIFDEEFLITKFKETGLEKVTVYGEAYGGKCQGMSGTYGKELKFVAFEVQIKDCWLAVPNAAEVVESLGLEFVYFTKTSTNLDELNQERDNYSVQADRNGCGKDKPSEGIVLRPLIEVTKNNGKRIIAKYKCEAFKETKTSRKVLDPDKLRILKEATAIAEEWVTVMRLGHILGKIENVQMENMPEIIRAMGEDVKREAEGEIVWSREVQKSISKETAKLVKQHFQNRLNSQPTQDKEAKE